MADELLMDRFDYDGSLGRHPTGRLRLRRGRKEATDLRCRFVVQAAVGHPITVYGKGGMTRGFLDILDTVCRAERRERLRGWSFCRSAVCKSPMTIQPRAASSACSINSRSSSASISSRSSSASISSRSSSPTSERRSASMLRYSHPSIAPVSNTWARCQIAHVENPRVEAEEHYYNAKNTGLRELGLEPHFLGDSMIDSMLEFVLKYKHRVRKELINPAVKWKETSVASATGSAAVLK